MTQKKGKKRRQSSTMQAPKVLAVVSLDGDNAAKQIKAPKKKENVWNLLMGYANEDLKDNVDENTL